MRPPSVAPWLPPSRNGRQALAGAARASRHRCSGRCSLACATQRQGSGRAQCPCPSRARSGCPRAPSPIARWTSGPTAAGGEQEEQGSGWQEARSGGCPDIPGAAQSAAHTPARPGRARTFSSQSVAVDLFMFVHEASPNTTRSMSSAPPPDPTAKHSCARVRGEAWQAAGGGREASSDNGHPHSELHGGSPAGPASRPHSLTSGMSGVRQSSRNMLRRCKTPPRPTAISSES